MLALGQVQFVKMDVVECLVLRDVNCGRDASMLCIRVEPQAISDCRIRHHGSCTKNSLKTNTDIQFFDLEKSTII